MDTFINWRSTDGKNREESDLYISTQPDYQLIDPEDFIDYVNDGIRNGSCAVSDMLGAIDGVYNDNEAVAWIDDVITRR